MTEAELLFTEILGCSRLSLYLDKDVKLGLDKSSRVALALRRRFYREPLQYILGKTEFMGLEFKVNKNVFIPRPETEVLVETAIKTVRSSSLDLVRLRSPQVARDKKFEVRSPEVLDIGTGCGNIAISIKKFLPYCQMYAMDISEAALKVASENAILHKTPINFFLSNIFHNFQLLPTCRDPAGFIKIWCGTTSNFQLIISNPPYIATKDIETLAPEIKYEPHIALDGGKDGLDFYRRLISEAPDYLKTGGHLVMEMGFGQNSLIQNILQESQRFELVEVVKDYNDIERVIVARKNG